MIHLFKGLAPKENKLLKNAEMRNLFMPIRIHNFAGRLGWNARKYLPRLSSAGYLKLQFITRRRSQKKYIDYLQQECMETIYTYAVVCYKKAVR